MLEEDVSKNTKARTKFIGKLPGTPSGSKFSSESVTLTSQRVRFICSLRILLRKYLGKLEVKSLAPDGTPCTGTTRGLLQRARITAGRLIPVGKETDRRWEQGEDPSMIDSEIFIYEKRSRLVIADPLERKKWSAIGLRRLMRASNLSQKVVFRILDGQPVRPRTMSTFRQAVDKTIA